MCHSDLRDSLTNRRSRGPCKTEALTLEALEYMGKCIGTSSTVAAGAIANDDSGVGWAWDGRKPQETMSSEEGGSGSEAR